jgi:putative transposase
MRVATVAGVWSDDPGMPHPEGGESLVTASGRCLPGNYWLARYWYMSAMVILLLHLLSRGIMLVGRGGARAVLAENLLLKHQLLVLNRRRRRAPRFWPVDRLLLGFASSFLNPRRLLRHAIILRPTTLLRFHRALRDLKYRLLYSSHPQRKPGPKGPDPRLIRLICDFKRRNPRFGCPRIAQHLVKTFGLQLNKDVVRRVLASHYRPEPHGGGPSWLTFLGHSKDSLWSLDLFCTESILLRTHWVLVVMDQFSRRIIGFAVQPLAVDGPALCRLFNQAIACQGQCLRLSFDHDPLFGFHRWQANLRVLGIEAIQTVPGVPVSHPFIERLIRTLRQECLDQLFYWNAADLEHKLLAFGRYYNSLRVHQGLGGDAPEERAGAPAPLVANLLNYRWQSHCRGLAELPIAA